MAKFIQIKFENPKMKQWETANQLGFSSSTLQRYRNDINMVSPYKIQPNNNNKRTKKVSNTNFDKKSHHIHDLKRPQMSSNDLKRPQSISESSFETNTESNKKNKNVLKAGSVRENIEINNQYLDDFIQNSTL